MALTVNHSSTNGKSLLIKLGVSKEALAEVLSLGWDVKLTAKSLSFMKGGGAHTVPLDLTTLNAIAASTITASQKAVLLEAVKAAMKLVLEGGAPTQQVEAPTLLEQGGMTFVATGLGKPKEPPVVNEHNVPVTAASKWGSFDPLKMKTAPLVKLRDATAMYQPVHGTSHGSRYYVVGGSADVRIAARLQGGTLSIRIEGNGWKAHQASIIACGFDNHGAAKDYTSLHVVVGNNTVLANKTLGAVLTGLGIPLDTPVPNAKLLAE